MRRFAPHSELAFEIAVERHTIVQEIVDAAGSFARKTECNVLVDDAAANCNGVSGMGFRRIAFADGGCDAALRPRARCTFAERCGGDDGDGTGASFSAQNRPASPPPTIRTSVVGETLSNAVLMALSFQNSRTSWPGLSRPSTSSFQRCHPSRLAEDGSHLRMTIGVSPPSP
jgi:hypothetical protein